MALAADAYYATREPFGAAGDFVTAPEISQMFGELLGAWAADLWQRAGSPPRLILAELGPGRGTLMADALRATRAIPGFTPAIHLVERSPRLRAVQREKLPHATWHDRLDTLPTNAPLILFANEFFDALPITQIERTATAWQLRGVMMDGDTARFTTLPEDATAFVPEPLRAAAPGAIYERSFAGESLAAAIGKRLTAQGGAALLIDYGHSGPALGDTLQAIHNGAFADPLTALGEADLSAHVDFTALATAARVTAHGPTDQGAFLHRLGIAARAETLKAGKPLAVKAEVEAALARLTHLSAMGRLFKAMALTAPGWPTPAGFA
ncbi:SAM-dependent methyltransferase [Sandaracinobacteroides saxicola]|uniref:SAM-dependent methyltransferase n=2 Tax=Sandaracinobacteroides saxicola TaxID=2759707 RepID=A0A7G5IMW5_9SPHN|nr:SAM-dependent methyltransferase [Sandaracinobacteroides saxicola]